MSKFVKLAAASLIGLALVVSGARWAYVTVTTETITETFVRDSERVCNADDAQKCRYLAFGAKETFENTDEWLFFKFNSSDVNRGLVKGATCEMKVYGLRIPFFSWYRNIIEAKCGTV